MDMKTTKRKIQAGAILFVGVAVIVVLGFVGARALETLMPILGSAPTILVGGAVTFGMGAILGYVILKLVDMLADRDWFQ